MSNIKAIEDLINGYATSEDSSFLIPNVTEDFLAVNRVEIQYLLRDLGMFDSKDLVAESSELIKTQKFKFSEIAAIQFLKMKSCYKGNQNKDLSTYTCIFKNVNGILYSWMDLKNY